MKKRVLVTGANGQLGKTIKELYACNQDYIQFTFTTKTELDISNKDEIKTYFNLNKFDYCINCAAYTNVEQAEINSEAVFKVNTEAVKCLAKMCKQNDTVLIQISTDFVFNGEALKPYKETDITNPINIYGESKLKAEQEIKQLLDNYFILRTSWLYSVYGNNFMKTMINLSKEKKELNIISNQIGTPTYTKDLAEVILKIIKSNSKLYGTYHYSNEGVTSWYEFAKTIFDLLGTKITINPIKSEAYPTLAKRPKYSVLDKSKINKILDIKAPFWGDSLKKAILNIR